MNKDIVAISAKIKEYSDALATIFVNDYKQMIGNEFDDLTTKQAMLLELLHEHSRTMNEIALHFSMTASAASQLVKKLEKSGFVKRDINMQNRREIIVSLDKKGTQYNQLVSDIEHYLISKYYAKLEIGDLEKFLDISKKLYQIALKVQSET